MKPIRDAPSFTSGFVLEYNTDMKADILTVYAPRDLEIPLHSVKRKYKNGLKCLNRCNHPRMVQSNRRLQILERNEVVRLISNDNQEHNEVQADPVNSIWQLYSLLLIEMCDIRRPNNKNTDGAEYLQTTDQLSEVDWFLCTTHLEQDEEANQRTC
jgi:hypothetical protein